MADGKNRKILLFKNATPRRRRRDDMALKALTDDAGPIESLSTPPPAGTPTDHPIAPDSFPGAGGARDQRLDEVNLSLASFDNHRHCGVEQDA